LLFGVAPLLLVMALPGSAVARDAKAATAMRVPDWGTVSEPSPAPARAIGGHALGCLGGAVQLPATGPGYQVMRPSRNRAYGHPTLVAFVKSFAKQAKAAGWPGVLVGDLAQPRGGPMPAGHASHQSGLDVDIWFTPSPKRSLSIAERNEMSAVSMVKAGGGAVDPAAWSSAQVTLLKLAATAPEVDRIFVNAVIKKAACAAAGSDRRWLAKLRPWWGHTHHFHVRLQCPEGETSCLNQEPVPAEDGCGAPLAEWLEAEAKARAEPKTPPAPSEPRRIELADLPPACRGVLFGG
jgi:penicillin-insensitive murein endopeptidase